jgi:hypothetical protein
MKIAVQGSNGESIVLDGPHLIFYRLHGEREVMRNLASTYVGTEIKPIRRKGAAPKNCDVTITCKATFEIKMPLTEQASLDRLVDQLELAAVHI